MRTKAKIGYSFSEDILVFRPIERKYGSSVQIGDVILDLDENRQIIGIELLRASKLFGTNKSILNNVMSGQAELSVSENFIKIHITLTSKVRNTDKTASFALRDIKPEFINPTKLRLAVA